MPAILYVLLTLFLRHWKLSPSQQFLPWLSICCGYNVLTLHGDAKIWGVWHNPADQYISDWLFLFCLFGNTFAPCFVWYMVVFAVQSFAGLTLRFSPASYWQVICGIVTGFIGGLSSVFSPPIVMYLLGRDADKDEFIAATGFLFCRMRPLVLALILNRLLV